MDVHLQVLIGQAREIQNSGRVTTLLKRVEGIMLGTIPQEEWSIRVHVPLVTAVLTEFDSLEAAYNQTGRGRISAVAWRARNLLELLLWSSYCAANDENSKTFFDEKTRDAIGVITRAEVFSTFRGNTEDLAGLADTKQKIVDAVEGIEDLKPGSYKRLRDIAVELEHGLVQIYDATYPHLSKFAHPTALLVLGSAEEVNPQLSDLFFSEGCMFFNVAFSVLEKLLFRTPPVA